MKKFICILTAFIMTMAAFTNYVSAHSIDTENDTIYNYRTDGTEYTIPIADSAISAEDQERTALKLIVAEENVAHCSSCSSGHTYGPLKDEYSTDHKVYRFDPQCIKQTYKVSVCEVCGYESKVLIKSTRITCCSASEGPELNGFQ